MDLEYTLLQEKLQYQFKDRTLLKKAVTHPGLILSSRAKRDNAFERLEFLGDRVLGLVIAELIFTTFPHEKEGDLAKRLAVLVSRESCTIIAQKLNLEKILNMPPEEMTPKTCILSDTMEAVIGALYLDGGSAHARSFVQREWMPLVQQNKKPPKDAKTALQEWSQRHGFDIPSYEIINVTGPSHAPLFVIRVSVGEHVVEEQGDTKRQAEQKAATLLLQKISKK